MTYWWVNHGQTYKSELGGGYIWSPKRGSKDQFNLGYENLTRVKQGDIIISFAETSIQAIGVSEAEFENVPKPKEFGNVGQNWGDEGYLVKVTWARLQNPVRIKEMVGFYRHLLPNKYSPIQPDTGNGNQTFYLLGLNDELAEFLLTLVSDKNPGITDEVESLTEVISDDQEVRLIENSAIPETERNQIVKARVGQGLFRQNVIDIEKACRITGVADSRFLIASHIKPWKISTNEERLDGNNGLLLSPHIDNLFDSGWISFANNGNVLMGVSVQEVAKRWSISVTNVGKFSSKQGKYLEFHRDVVFGQRRVTTVAAGVVEHNGRILIARRKVGLNFAGYWEFPGGKLEDDESPQNCLMREFEEELSIEIKVGEYIGQSWLKKSGKNIHLVAFRCEFIKGDINLTVHDEFAWVIKSQLSSYKMAPADVPIVKSL